MFAFHRCFSCVLLLVLLGALSGCEMFSSEAWQRPSPLSGKPPAPPEGKHESQGGFTVLVGSPGQPTAARVTADLAAFAQARGFVRQSASPAAPDGSASPQPGTVMPSRYLSGDIKLDVAYQNSDQRVVASLHSFSSRLNRKFVNRFYEDFRQQYAAGYGDDAPMFENDYAEDSLWGGSVSEGGSGQGGNSRGRSGR